MSHNFETVKQFVSKGLIFFTVVLLFAQQLFAFVSTEFQFKHLPKKELIEVELSELNTAEAISFALEKDPFEGLGDFSAVAIDDFICYGWQFHSLHASLLFSHLHFWESVPAWLRLRHILI